jgi:hypothetical protein
VLRNCSEKFKQAVFPVDSWMQGERSRSAAADILKDP